MRSVDAFGKRTGRVSAVLSLLRRLHISNYNRLLEVLLTGLDILCRSSSLVVKLRNTVIVVVAACNNVGRSRDCLGSVRNSYSLFALVLNWFLDTLGLSVDLRFVDLGVDESQVEDSNNPSVLNVESVHFSN